MHGHPDLPRFQVQIRRAAKYADEHLYWEGCLDALVLVAVDLGYSYDQVQEWLRVDVA
jgi:hypothetical protein